MIQISISKFPVSYEFTLDGKKVNMNFYYSIFSDRFMMNIENIDSGEKATGVFLNAGRDILATLGRLGLQSLVAVSLPLPGLESDQENWADSVQLIYMTNEEYRDIRYGKGSAVVPREIWND